MLSFHLPGLMLIYISVYSGMANPFTWVKERFMPETLTPMTRTEEESMREADKAKGQGSIFDEVPKLIEETETKGLAKESLSLKTSLPSKKKTQVR